MVSVITDLQLSLDEGHILRGQGIDPDRARPEIVSAARDVLDKAQGLFTPAAMFTTLPVRDFQHHQVTLEGGVVFEGPLVARALAGGHTSAWLSVSARLATETRRFALLISR